jgi:hypothetical protein
VSRPRPVRPVRVRCAPQTGVAAPLRFAPALVLAGV